MQVPNPVVGRTNDNFTPLQPPQVHAVPGAFGEQIGSALSGLGNAALDWATTDLTRARAQDTATEKFKTLSAFDEFQTASDNKLQELKRSADPSGKGYVKTAMSTLDTDGAAFLQTVPEKLRPEFEYRLTNFKGNALTKSTDFQYAQNDQFFKTGIAASLDASKKAVYADGTSLEAQRQAYIEKVQTAALPESVKADYIRQGNQALEMTAYGRDYVQQKLDAARGVNRPVNYGPKSEIQALGQHIDNLTPQAKGILDGIAEAGVVPVVKISSGTREVGENAARGGALKSQHIPNAAGQGNAIDIDTSGMSDAEKAGVLRAAVESGAKGVGIYASGNHIHLDARSTPTVWGAKGTGAEKITDQPAWAQPVLAEMFGGKVPQRNGSPTSGDPSDMETYIRTAGMKESSGKIYAQNPDSSAGGLFQFTDDTWRAMTKAHPELGLTDKMDPHQQHLAMEAFTKDNDKILQQHGLDVTNKNRYIMHFLGSGNGPDFLKMYQANPDQIPGHEFDKQRESNRSVFYKMEGGHYIPRTVGEIYALQTQKFGGGVDRGLSALDNNPAYSNVTLEDRLALQKDGDAEVQRTLQAQQQQLTQLQQQTMNTALNGVIDGKIGRADVDAMRHSGQLTDATDALRLYSEIDKRDADQISAAAAGQAIASGEKQDLGDDKWKKNYNALFGKDAQAQLRAANGDFVSTALVPAAIRSGDIPTNAAGVLTAMVRDPNPTKSKFAYDAMNVLEQAAPDAYKLRFSDGERSMARAYAAAKVDGTADQFLERMNGPGAEEWRRQLPQMQKEAQEFLDGKVKVSGKEVPTSQVLFDRVIGNFTTGIYGFRSVAHAPAYPLAQMAMQQDFRDEFTQEYTIYRDPTKATEAAIDNLTKRWGASDLGGQRVVMKDPPEKVGYTSFSAGPGAPPDFSWIDRQVRDDLARTPYAIKPGERYELVSDTQTARERAAFGTTGTGPSYQIVKYDAQGIPTVIPATKGPGNRRLNFVLPQGEKDEAANATKYKEAIQEALPKIALEEQARAQAGMSGTPVPAEVTQEADKARATVDSFMPKAERDALTKEKALNQYQALEEDVFNFKLDHPYLTPLPPEMGKKKAFLEEYIYGNKWGKADASTFRGGDVQPAPEMQ